MASAPSGPPYCASWKGSQRARAPSTARAAWSSARRTPITSSPSWKPAAASHGVSGAPAGGRPAKIVTTTLPGRLARSSPTPSTASSQCGDKTSRQPPSLERFDEEALTLAVVELDDGGMAGGGPPVGAALDPAEVGARSPT